MDLVLEGHSGPRDLREGNRIFAGSRWQLRNERRVGSHLLEDGEILQSDVFETRSRSGFATIVSQCKLADDDCSGDLTLRIPSAHGLHY